MSNLHDPRKGSKTEWEILGYLECCSLTPRKIMCHIMVWVVRAAYGNENWRKALCGCLNLCFKKQRMICSSNGQRMHVVICLVVMTESCTFWWQKWKQERKNKIEIKYCLSIISCGDNNRSDEMDCHNWILEMIPNHKTFYELIKTTIGWNLVWTPFIIKCQQSIEGNMLKVIYWTPSCLVCNMIHLVLY